MEYILKHEGLTIFFVSVLFSIFAYVLRKIHVFELTVENVKKHEEIIQHLDSELVELERKLITFGSDLRVLASNVDTLKIMVKESSSKIDLLQSTIFATRIRDLEKQQ